MTDEVWSIPPDTSVWVHDDEAGEHPLAGVAFAFWESEG